MRAPTLPVVRIQRHCLQDGPGVRTTVFLQGCALACPWCANPEAIPLAPGTFFDERTCIRSSSPGSPLCASCSLPDSNRPPATCPLGAVRPTSAPLALDEIHRHLLKDAALYRDSGGGVTFSGGEPFLHAQSLLPLLRQLRQEAIPVAVETSGHFPPENAKMLLPFIDHLLLDLKMLRPPVLNPEITLPPDAFEQNLRTLHAASPHLTYRLLLIQEFLDAPGKVDALLARLHALPPAPMELLPLHALAEQKYRQLGRPFIAFSAPTAEACESLRRQIQSLSPAPVRLLHL